MTGPITPDAPPDWTLAACADVEPELFFPVGHSRADREQTAEAKAVCAGCLIRAACLEYALATKAEGVWGGLDNDDRHRLRNRRRKKAWKARGAVA